MAAYTTDLLPSQEKRVVLIGCTGHGKGTFGNFLYNLGEPKSDGSPPVFEESADLEPHTQFPYHHLMEIQNSPNASNARKTMSFNILDTPGLNDNGREKDLNHMMDTLKIIGEQFHSVHTLVLVCRISTRMDPVMSSAFRYYRDLFSPLFKAHNVILVLTHVSSDGYERMMEYKTWEHTVRNHLEKCNEVLELKTREWNCPIKKCFFVNSKWSRSKIKGLLEKLTTNEDLIEDDLLYQSYLMREKILDHISQATEISLDSHLIPLPVTLEDERNSALSVIDRAIKQLQDTIDIKKVDNASILKDIKQLETRIANNNAYITDLEGKITNLSVTQKTPEKNIDGDDFIKISNAGRHSILVPCNTNSPCGGCRCNLQMQKHNASRSRELKPHDNAHWVEVKPGLFNIIKKEDRRWYCKFWLEYSGEKHNAKEIQSHRETQDRCKVDLRNCTEELEGKKDEQNSCEEQLAKYDSNLSSLNSDKNLLQPKLFKIDNIYNVLACIQKFMGSQK